MVGHDEAVLLLPKLTGMAIDGEIFTPQDQLAEQLEVNSRKRVRALLKTLESLGHIQLETSPLGTKIKVL